MKTHTLTILLTFICSFAFSQKVIENPEYGFSTYPGEITKIEMRDTTTVLHFKIKTLPWGYFHLFQESYIQNLSGDNKLFVSKVTGANFKRNDFPPSGEVMYQLYFPPLSNTVKTIDFGVEKERGWRVHDIILQEDENSLLLPKELRGNWLLADGSNRWDYGFNSKYAIVDGSIWNYESIDKKGGKYKVILENGGDLKTIYAKLDKVGDVAFGNAAKALKSYSLTKVFNPDFKLKEDGGFKDLTFALDSTTYSGVIKGFSDKMEQKTAMIYVNNVFKGGQESHLVKINDDGSFQSKFPLTHPQTVFVRLFSGAYTVFLEPNKKTFHFIDGKASFFMGDNAQVNSDLDALKDITFRLGMKERKEIGKTAPETYKETCFKLRENTLNELATYQKSNFVSQKALQIKNLDLDLSFYQELLGYDMYRRSLQHQNEKAKKEADKMPYKEFEVSESYYDFLPNDVADNSLLALSNGYYFFVNRLIYADIFKANLNSKLTSVDIANWLQENDVELTDEELNMVAGSKQIETPEAIEKEVEFRKAYGDTEQEFYKKYKNHFSDVQAYIKSNDAPKQSHFILDVVGYLNEKDIKITEDEADMVEALRTLKSPEEIEAESSFNNKFSEAVISFRKKYQDDYSKISSARRYTARDKKIKAFFGKENAFLFDVIKMQELSKPFEDYIVYSDDALVNAQQELNTPFLKNYLALSNAQTIEKMEINKIKGGYNVNEVEKNEGDELFDAMLKKFKGKVVYVDFWATWCGPCKSGIKRIAPLKEEMKDDNVVFLYITNQSSPEDTWENSIANIKGEHYRVSSDEWNYLADKFSISGIPHYTLVNKNGEVVKPKMGYLPNDRLKTILKTEMTK